MIVLLLKLIELGDDQGVDNEDAKDTSDAHA
jgi:hypothetical protein